MHYSHTVNTFWFRRNRSEIWTALRWKSLMITILLVFSHPNLELFLHNENKWMHRCEWGSKFNVHWFSGSFCCQCNFSASFSIACHCQGFYCSQLTSITTLYSSVKPVSPTPLFMHFIFNRVFEPGAKQWVRVTINSLAVKHDGRSFLPLMWHRTSRAGKSSPSMWQCPQRQLETYSCTENHHSATFEEDKEIIFINKKFSVLCFTCDFLWSQISDHKT